MAEVLHLVHGEFGTLALTRAPLEASLTNSTKKFPTDLQATDASEINSTADSFKVDPNPSDTPHTATIHLDDKLIGRGRIGRVYRGHIQPLDDSSDSHILHATQVIVKLVIPQGRVKGRKLYPSGHDGLEILADLGREAAIYSLMHGIQGEVVPRCYGHYYSDVAACLVLQDCGEDLKFPYRRLPLEERRIIFELQKRLHQIGVSHGDVARRNFVKGLQGIRLLDFDKAVRHQCQGFEEPKFEADAAKEAENVCSELRKLFYAFGLLPMEYYPQREREAYKPWDGEAWWP